MMFTGAKKIGSGVYGKCYSVKESKSKKEFVIKKNITDDNVSFIATIREMDILSRLPDHPHVIKLLDIYMVQPYKLTEPKKKTVRDDIYFRFDRANVDVYDYIKNVDHIDYAKMKQFFVHALLGVEFIHHNKIMHRDIKPANMLIFERKSDSDGNVGVLQIADFGLSKPHTKQGYDTPGMGTAWYRAPEILRRKECKYDFKIDVWSRGCCLFEMLTRNPLFRGVEEDEEIIEGILSRLRHPPTDKELEILDYPDKIPSNYKSWEEHLNFNANKKEQFEKDFGTFAEFSDLMDKMMEIDPDERITASEALNHPIFSEFENLIKITRKNHMILFSNHRSGIHNCIEREWAYNIVIKIFNERHSSKNKKWYTPRVVFQAVDIFDRYLSGYYSLSDNSEHTEKEVELYFYVCLYIAIKYFSSIHAPTSFNELVDFKYNEDDARNFEKALVEECLEYKIYRDTAYECADNHGERLEPKEVRDLLQFIFEYEEIEGLTPQQIYEKFRCCKKENES